MVITCWSVKGGSGTTVVATSLALLLSRLGTIGALLADLGGDVPPPSASRNRRGRASPNGCSSARRSIHEALARLEVDAAPGLRLLPAGAGPPPPAGQGTALAEALAADPRAVVVDAGTVHHDAALELAAAATTSLLVLRPCYLALRRAVAAPVRGRRASCWCASPAAPSAGATSRMCSASTSAAEIDLDPAIARAVDAGLLASRLPRTLARSLRQAA